MKVDYFVILNIIVLLTAGQTIARSSISLAKKMLYATLPVMLTVVIYLLTTDGSKKYAVMIFNYFAIILLIYMETVGWAYVEKWASKIWHVLFRRK